MRSSNFQFQLSRRHVEAWSLRAVDVGIASVLLVAPLFFGGRHELGLLVYAAIVALTATAWKVNQAVTDAPSPRASTLATAMILAAVALVALQLAPMPPNVVHVVAPGLVERLPAWGADGAALFSEWSTLSAHPWATRIGLATLATHALLFSIMAGRVRSAADVAKVVQLTAVASAAMAALALVQFASQTDDLLWCYPLAYRDVSQAVLGSFTTPNHCGHFLALGAGAALYCLAESANRLNAGGHTSRGPAGIAARKKNQVRVALWLAALASIVLAVLLTFSRGAAVALAMSLTVACVVLVRAGWVGRKHMLAGFGVTVSALIALSLGEYDAASDKAGGVTVSELSRLADTSSRDDVWQANLDAVASNPILGFGVGSHPHVYQMFMAAPATVLYTHAECGYLQVASETGLVGAALLAGAIALVVAWIVRGACFAADPSEQALWAVISSAVAASLVHSTVDFVWYIPACLSPVVLLTACAARLTRLDSWARSDQEAIAGAGAWLSRAALPLAGVATVVVLIGPASASLAIDRYEAASMALKKYAASRFAKAASSDGEEEGAQLLESQAYYTAEMVEALVRAERADPGNPRTHLRLARLRVAQFELAQAAAGAGIGLDGVRDAALAADFESREALDEWLSRAFGDASLLLTEAERHARCAVRLCPLQGQGYLRLADLRFLAPHDERDADALVAQALRVRPYDGGVLFDAGAHHLLAGRHEEALALWKEAAGRPGAHRRKLAAAVASVVPAEAFINEFHPDWWLAYIAFEMYQRRGNDEDLRALARHAIVAAAELTEESSPLVAAHKWRYASRMQLSLGDVEQAVECAERAFQLSPNVLEVRLALANALYQAERYEEADPHIRWCLARRPDNKGLRVRLERIARSREEARPRVATAGRARWSTTFPAPATAEPDAQSQPPYDE